MTSEQAGVNLSYPIILGGVGKKLDRQTTCILL